MRNADIVGFAAYECTRRGLLRADRGTRSAAWPGHRTALLLRCLASMWELGYAYAVIGGVEHTAFYQKVCGAFVIQGSVQGIYGPTGQR